MSCIDYTMHPEVIALCTSCTSISCSNGMCAALINKVAEIRGVPVGEPKKRNPSGNSHQQNVAKYEINGEVHTVPEWCRIKGINYNTIMTRKRKGYTLEEALTMPVVEPKGRAGVLHEINGEAHTLREWCEMKKINYQTVMARMNKGISLECALNTPVDGMHKRKHRTLEEV